MLMETGPGTVAISDKERAQVASDLMDLQKLFGVAQSAAMQIEIVAFQGGFDVSPVKPQLDTMIEVLAKAQEPCGRLSSILYRTGVAARPSTGAQSSDDLAFLSNMGTDDSHELLDLLERAQVVAERIDVSRGRCVDESIPLRPGESRGTDLAESVSVLALRVRKEAIGGQSRHE